MVWVLLGGLVVLILLAVMLSRARVPHDGVDNFRRQIDALSPEARRPVVGRVNEARQSPRDHGLTVRRVTAVTPTDRDSAAAEEDADSEPSPESSSHKTDVSDSGADTSTGSSEGDATLDDLTANGPDQHTDVGDDGGAGADGT